MPCLTKAAAVASLLVPFVAGVPYISINSQDFINNSTGDRFEIIGIDYQPGGSSAFSTTADPLSDPNACLRDAILMQQMGVNAIRVYNVDGNIDHNQCVSIFNAAGIYMVIDVNSGLYGEYIDRSNPGSTYNEAYLTHVFQVIEAFADYPNTLGFWAANEIINQNSTADAPAYIRAVVRDMKDYIAHNVARTIPVGYSAADVSELLVDTWNYLSCEDSSSPESKIDFFGLNDYEWCGDSSYTVSGYNQLVAQFSGASIPVFFSEYGCNLVMPRTFTEVGALYGVNMTVFSGGFVYEWTQEANLFGLVDVNSSSEVTILTDYGYLKEQFASIDLTSLASAKTTTATASACNTASISAGTVFPTGFSIPARPSGVDSIISSGGVSSATKGEIVSITATSMPATVYNTAGAVVSNLALVEYACNEINSPGLVSAYTSKSASCSSVTGTATAGSSSSSGSGSKSSASHVSIMDLRWAIGVAVGIFVGAIML